MCLRRAVVVVAGVPFGRGGQDVAVEYARVQGFPGFANRGTPAVFRRPRQRGWSPGQRRSRSWGRMARYVSRAVAPRTCGSRVNSAVVSRRCSRGSPAACLVVGGAIDGAGHGPGLLPGVRRYSRRTTWDCWSRSRPSSSRAAGAVRSSARRPRLPGSRVGQRCRVAARAPRKLATAKVTMKARLCRAAAEAPVADGRIPVAVATSRWSTDSGKSLNQQRPPPHSGESGEEVRRRAIKPLERAV